MTDSIERTKAKGKIRVYEVSRNDYPGQACLQSEDQLIVLLRGVELGTPVRIVPLLFTKKKLDDMEEFPGWGEL